MNNLYSSPKKVYTLQVHNLTVLLKLDREKFETICMVLTLGALPLGPHEGHMYHMNNFESPAPRDDSCQVWLKFNHAFQEDDETVTFYKGPPPPTCYSPQGPIGATLGTPMNNFYSSPNKVKNSPDPEGSGEEDV